MLLAQLGEAETALWRLLTEQRKTQKRVNALKYNVIPRYQTTIRYIESAIRGRAQHAVPTEGYAQPTGSVRLIETLYLTL